MLKQLKKEVAEEQIREFFQKMEQLGYTPNETLSLMQRFTKECD